MKTPYKATGGTQLSEAYAKGLVGLPCPRFIMRGTAAHRAWKLGAKEFYEKVNAICQTEKTDCDLTMEDYH